MLKVKNILKITNKSSKLLNRTLITSNSFFKKTSEENKLLKANQKHYFSTATIKTDLKSSNINLFNNKNKNSNTDNNNNNNTTTTTNNNNNNTDSINNLNQGRNFSSTIYENASHFIKKNFANMLFVFKYYTQRRTDLLGFVREFYIFFATIDDKFIILLLKKIFVDVENLEFEELDKVCVIVLKKGIRDFEVLRAFKKFIIILPQNFTYANIGNLMLQVDQMGILTNDSHLRKFYSEFVISGLMRLNYNDLIFTFDGLSKVNKVDAYVWNIGQYLILKKFNKLYRINSLRRLVSSFGNVGLKDTAFWKIVDQYIYYNFEKIPQIAIILEIICYVNKNLGCNSLGERTFIKFFNLVVSRKTFKDFKILVNAYEYIKDLSEKTVEFEKSENLNFNNENNNNSIDHRDKESKNKNICLSTESTKSPYIYVSNKSLFFDKLKAHLKNCLETQLDQMDIEIISVLFEKDKNYSKLKDFNSKQLSDKHFSLFLERIDTFPKDWQYKFYFEMGKYDSRFTQYASKLRIDTNNRNNNSYKINSQLNEFNFLMMVKSIKEYEKTEEPNAKFFLAFLINNFNEILNEDLDTKYFELLITLIPFFPNILKILSADLKKKKLNNIINAFIEYKSQVFTKGRDFGNREKNEKNEKENKRKLIGESLESVENNSEICYDKLILLVILNSLNPKKLNLQGELQEIIQNSEQQIKIDISKSYLIQVVGLIYNLSLDDLEAIYKMKFYDSVYDKYVN